MRTLPWLTLLVAVTFDAVVAAQPAPAPKITPRAPGLYPLLVIHPQEDKPHAYILACAKVVRGKPAKLLGPKACAPLLKTTPLEVLQEGKRTAVKIAGSGTGYPCPADGKVRQPRVKIRGLPAELQRPTFLVGVGVPMQTEIDPKAEAAITAKHPPGPGKRPGPPELGTLMQVDLDGDGSYEVVTESMGHYEVFTAGGELLGEVGCEFG